jgi:hypothetical protein
MHILNDYLPLLYSSALCSWFLSQQEPQGHTSEIACSQYSHCKCRHPTHQTHLHSVTHPDRSLLD